jgi:hypothetical protein
MGSVHIHLDLSHENEQRQDQLLATDMRLHGEIPANHFWQTVYHDYYRNDIAQTGNDHRFRSHHRWVDDEFRRYDHLQARRHHAQLGDSHQHTAVTSQVFDPPPFPLEISQQIHGGSIPATPPGANSGVPEPSGMILLGLGLIVAWRGWGRLQLRKARPGYRAG